MESLLFDLPPGAVAGLIAACLAFSGWLSWKVLPLYRALVAIRSTPLAPMNTSLPGLVKVMGKAHPAEVPAGYGIPDHVWQETSVTPRPGFSSGTTSVARIAIRDETGECVLHAEEAKVVPSDINVDTDRRFFAEDIVTSTRFIRTGDAVFAVGVLGGNKALPGETTARRRLRPGANGVLVLSGKREPGAIRYFGIRCYTGFALAIAGLGFAAWIWWLRPLF